MGRLRDTIKQMLKVLVREAQDDWDDHLPYVLMAYRDQYMRAPSVLPTSWCWIEKLSFWFNGRRSQWSVWSPMSHRICGVGKIWNMLLSLWRRIWRTAQLDKRDIMTEVVELLSFELETLFGAIILHRPVGSLVRDDRGLTWWSRE